MEKKIIVGGGCFWCTEAMFRELNGVINVKSGYCGGHLDNPTYQDICYEETGHAEVVEIIFNDEIIGYEELLVIHMTTHNPTTLNQQGADKGTQYRSVIFFQTKEEEEIAHQVIKNLQTSYDNPIVTEVTQLEKFYDAEDYHQDYYAKNTQAGYCQVVITPKLNKLREYYAKYLK